MSDALKEKIRALERRRAHLRRQATQLSIDQKNLHLRNAMLRVWCESLSSLFQVCSTTDCQTTEIPDEVAAQSHFMLEQELKLLQATTMRDSLAWYDVDGAPGLPDPGLQTISPAGDPMDFFRHTVAQGLLPQAASWTPVEVAGMLRETVLRSSLYFNLQEAQQVMPRTRVVSPKELWDR